MPLSELMRRPEAGYEKLREAFDLPEIAPEVRQQVETDIFYEGYIQKQLEQVERMERWESKLLPEDIDYGVIPNLRDEAREKLTAEDLQNETKKTRKVRW